MKSEREKMLAGELYVAADPELSAIRMRARELFSRYNALPYGDEAGKRALLDDLLGAAGSNLDIQSPFYCDYGQHIYLGNNCFMNFNCIILDCAEVRMGDWVMLGPNVQIYTAYHPLDAAERCKGPELASPITIGSRVWIGGGAILCPGITIGNDTTIGAGSVVTKDIPAGVFAAGNPCRVIRSL
ncbi:MAG: sugar O-acetyltransferase [Bacteroidia bacterium]|nr:sugar O-acetyltransferase [Bacteroidia bacterium]